MSMRRPDSLRIWMDRASGDSVEEVTRKSPPKRRSKEVVVVRRRNSMVY
jgi:hypothetical protein